MRPRHKRGPAGHLSRPPSSPLLPGAAQAARRTPTAAAPHLTSPLAPNPRPASAVGHGPPTATGRTETLRTRRPSERPPTPGPARPPARQRPPQCPGDSAVPRAAAREDRSALRRCVSFHGVRI
ncbi:hypothetical protein PVAP13_1KG308805 [Panicum virgatum]|uniref:Uncharacterized protein n=1 Tax=Panicum virgatum TaxID=38727 RepID=A0A8T0XIM1_PANVG|nr:hypothetical protein PVAP13_1KG308805 [Panicum virgatum]